MGLRDEEYKLPLELKHDLEDIYEQVMWFSAHE
jgi:hypothetical protein